MIRNLKVLGLAMVAAFAFSAVAASAAMAVPQGFLTTDGDSVTLDATEEGVQENGLTAFGGGATRCTDTVYTGHEVDTTNPKNPVPNGATTVTLTPHYSGCTSTSGGSTFFATVETTSCDYVLHIGTTTEGENTYGASADIECDNPGDEIHVRQFTNSGEGLQVCSVTIPEQTDLTGAHVTDETNGHLRIKGTFKGIKASRAGLCGAASTETAEFHINATVSGTNAAEEETEIGISDEA